MALPFPMPGYNSLLTGGGFQTGTPIVPLPGLGGGPVPGAAPATGGSFMDAAGSAFMKMSPWLAAAGAVQGAISAYYQAKSEQMQLKSKALTFEHQQFMSQLNARQAEYQAQNILLAGERQIGQYTMRAGQAKAGAKASMAARGGVLGEGSNLEMLASMDYAKEVDMLTINANTVRAAAAARTQRVNYENQALMEGVSAANLRASASTISPTTSAFTSLLSGATSVGSAWYQNKIAAALGIG